MDSSRRLLTAAVKAAAALTVAVAGGEPGADQVAFGPQHGGQVPGLVGVEQGQQIHGRRRYRPARARNARPAATPSARPRADPDGVGVGQAARAWRRHLGRLARGGGEGLQEADPRLHWGSSLVRGVRQWASMPRPFAASPRSAASQPRFQLSARCPRPVGVRRLGEFGLGGIPVTELVSASATFMIAAARYCRTRCGAGARRRSGRLAAAAGSWPPSVSARLSSARPTGSYRRPGRRAARSREDRRSPAVAARQAW